MVESGGGRILYDGVPDLPERPHSCTLPRVFANAAPSGKPETLEESLMRPVVRLHRPGTVWRCYVCGALKVLNAVGDWRPADLRTRWHYRKDR